MGKRKLIKFSTKPSNVSYCINVLIGFLRTQIVRNRTEGSLSFSSTLRGKMLIAQQLQSWCGAAQGDYGGRVAVEQFAKNAAA